MITFSFYRYFTCSGCHDEMRITLNLLQNVILSLCKAKCYRCFYFNDDLDMCSELGQCKLCCCHYYVTRDSVCPKYRKSKW